MMDNKINSQIISSNSSICLYEYSYTVDDPELKLEPSLQMDLCEDETESIAESEPVMEPESEQVVEQASAVVEETSTVVEETSVVEPINENNDDNSNEEEIVVVPKRTYKRKRNKNQSLEKC